MKCAACIDRRLSNKDMNLLALAHERSRTILLIAKKYRPPAPQKCDSKCTASDQSPGKMQNIAQSPRILSDQMPKYIGKLLSSSHELILMNPSCNRHAVSLSLVRNLHRKKATQKKWLRHGRIRCSTTEAPENMS